MSKLAMQWEDPILHSSDNKKATDCSHWSSSNLAKSLAEILKCLILKSNIYLPLVEEDLYENVHAVLNRAVTAISQTSHSQLSDSQYRALEKEDQTSLHPPFCTKPLILRHLLFFPELISAVSNYIRLALNFKDTKYKDLIFVFKDLIATLRSSKKNIF